MEARSQIVHLKLYLLLSFVLLCLPPTTSSCLGYSCLKETEEKRQIFHLEAEVKLLPRSELEEGTVAPFGMETFI